jgi:hypothetical protein
LYYEGFLINVILLEDALGIGGSVCHNKDDSYTIFIDSRLSYERQVEICEHELNHIRNRDFEKENVNEIEYRAYAM